MSSSKGILATILALAFSASVTAGDLLPKEEGQSVRTDVMIDMPRGYVSGMCVMQRRGDDINACILNEFGITAIAFVYDGLKDEVRLVSLIDMLDKRRVRRTLRKDLRHLIHNMREGKDTYTNEKHNITYTLSSQDDAQR